MLCDSGCTLYFFRSQIDFDKTMR